ncbi:MAG: hypothetical protein ACOCXT_06220 [Candidatus Dojkabacteria bacterium]
MMKRSKRVIVKPSVTREAIWGVGDANYWSWWNEIERSARRSLTKLSG